MNARTLKRAAVVAMLLFSIGAYAGGKQREWRQGVLKDVAVERESRMLGIYSGGTQIGNTSTAHGSLVQVPITIMSYTIETADYEFVAGRSMRRRDKPLSVTINDAVSFAVEKTDLYLKDDAGKEHKLVLMKKTHREQK